MRSNIIYVLLAIFCSFQAYSQSTIINHSCTGITQIPESAILTAKQNLHIAYGHTSHGSQVTDGMTGLIAFMNGKGYTTDLYKWNNGGTGGALDLHDYAMGGDAGYYPDWVNNTRTYLGTPDAATGRGTGTYADVNVIIWSWCGQVDDKFAAGTLTSEYLTPMAQLESEYPGIKFVYMTGHLDHSDDAHNKAANQAVRDFCINNNKILYDFADIESYDPDNNYYQYASDDCSYYSDAGVLLGNWATGWQSSHTVNVDWYDCGAAHSQSLNANQKAYAAWWLWSRLAGWDPLATSIMDQGEKSRGISVFPNPSGGKFTVRTNNSSINTIEIYNLTGTRIFSIPDTRILPANEIDLTGFAKGIYFIKIYCRENIYSQKILIQ
jgi:hypothetical protein